MAGREAIDWLGVGEGIRVPHMTKKNQSSGIITNEMEIYIFETSCCFDHLLSSIGTGASLMNEKMRQLSLMDMKIGHSRPFPHRNRRPMPLDFAKDIPGWVQLNQSTRGIPCSTIDSLSSHDTDLYPNQSSKRTCGSDWLESRKLSSENEFPRLS